MRLDKYICESTELTRSSAKKALHRGDVTCDGVVVKKSDFKVSDSCEVRLENVRLMARGLRYIMLNKPADTLCSNVDEDGYPSVLSLLDVDKARTLHIAGRLDADTTGLVLITDDGQWSHKVTSPGKKCGKRYRIRLSEQLQEADFESIVKHFSEGIQLRGETRLTRPATLEICSPNEVLLTLFEGKYHQVKRMFAALGNKVIGLHREQVGQIELDDELEPGQWRYLSRDEIDSVTL